MNKLHTKNLALTKSNCLLLKVRDQVLNLK
jgi:hypothetical protein